MSYTSFLIFFFLSGCSEVCNTRFRLTQVFLKPHCAAPQVGGASDGDALSLPECVPVSPLSPRVAHPARTHTARHQQTRRWRECFERAVIRWISQDSKDKVLYSTSSAPCSGSVLLACVVFFLSKELDLLLQGRPTGTKFPPFPFI